MQIDPAHDPVLHRLLRELFDPQQLRQFLRDWGGYSIADQLPGEIASLEAVADVAIVLLRRNGMLDRSLFLALQRARPGQHALLSRLCEQCGCGPLDAASGADAIALPPVRTPDYVVQHTYESLRAQRDVAREFVNHFSLPKILMLAGGTGSAEKFTAILLEWLNSRAGELTYPPVRNAVQHLGLAITGLAAPDEGIRLITLLGTFLAAPQIEAHLTQVRAFAALSEVQLWELVLRELAPAPRALPQA
jgi:hypothetical protein